MELVQLKEVVARYGKVNILRDVNINVVEGDILGIIGRSGSGKTTLLNLISGFLEPAEGEIIYYPGPNVGAKDLNKNIYKFKKDFGFTPQHNSFYPQLTVKENLNYFGKLYGLKKETLFKNIENLLKFTQLYNQQNKLAQNLSGGMQKRLDISCSLTHKPKILILDEPTSDLDPLLQKELLMFLKEINKQGVTIIVASHDLKSIEKICNKVAIIHSGKVHTHGSIEEIRKPFKRKGFRINFNSSQNKEKIIKSLERLPINQIIDQGYRLSILSENSENIVRNLIHYIEENNLDLNEIDLSEVSLNQIFEDIVRE